jgi:hypothetical protein
MISLNSDYDPLPSSQEELKNLIKDTMEKFGAYSVGSTHGGLSPTNIQDIIAFIMYSENCANLNITISKSEDDYHLNLSINEKN